MRARSLIAALQARASPSNVAGMARFGISTKGTLGVSVPALRKLAKQAGRSHELAAELWASGIHEARILATLVDEPSRVNRRQMDQWARDLDSWDVCDHACHNLLRYTPFAAQKAIQWTRSRQEFVRRAGFSLMAGLAARALDTPDSVLEAFLPLILDAATDERNFVKKAVSWALRQIGKRNARLRRKTAATAERIRKLDSPAARWVAAGALRELRRNSQAGGLRHVGRATSLPS